MRSAIPIAMALGLCAAACVDGTDAPPAEDTTETTQELQDICTVRERGVIVVSNGFWLNPKTCCKRALSSPNEQWCYSCTDSRYDCFGFL